MAHEHNENDARRDFKLILGLTLGAVALVIGGGYSLWALLYTPPPVASQLNLDRVAGASQHASTETPAYRELLKTYNQQGVNEAQRANGSFIASIPLAQESVVPPAPEKQTPPPPRSTGRERHSDGRETAADMGKRDERRQQALDDLLKRIKPPVETPRSEGVQVAHVLGGIKDGQGGQSGLDGGDYQRWSETLPGGARVQNTALTHTPGGSAAGVAAIEIVPPYWRGPGVIDIGVDSDNSTTPVLGKLPTGRYAGAVLKASEGAKLTGDGVVIHFTEMAFGGINYKVDAYALQDDTLLANVATDVNHRYLSRIVLPALLSGIGGIGEMYAQANTQLVTNGFNAQTVRPGVPDGSAVMGAIAGGAAGQAAKVLSEDAGRTPTTQVTVIPGQVVAIQFMRGVYAGDAIAPGQGGEAVRPSLPAQASVTTATPPPASAPVTEEQWRAQTQTRIQAQRRLLEK